MDIEQLNIKYGIAGQLKFVMESGGFPLMQICNRSATALISVYAAQVLSFQPVEESEDLLFLSPKAYYDDGKAIRGGVPVCWPWYGSDPADLKRPNHGFVRNNLWAVSGTEATNDFEKLLWCGIRGQINLKKCLTWKIMITNILFASRQGM